MHFLVIFLLFILFISFLAFFQFRRLGNALKIQETKRSGKIIGKAWQYGRLEFSHNQHKVSFFYQYGSRNSSGYTVVRSKLELSKKISAIISPVAYKDKVWKSSKENMIISNNHEFDKIFKIKGRNEFEILSFLTPEIQSILLQMKHCRPTIEIDKRKYALWVPNHNFNQSVLNLIIDNSLLLIDSLDKWGK